MIDEELLAIHFRVCGTEDIRELLAGNEQALCLGGHVHHEDAVILGLGFADGPVARSRMAGDGAQPRETRIVDAEEPASLLRDSTIAKRVSGYRNSAIRCRFSMS